MLRTRITFKLGPQVIADLTGQCSSELPIETLSKIFETERFLEQISGFRVHIFLESVEV